MLEKSLLEAFLLPFELLLLLLLVGVGVYYSDQTPLRNVTKTYLEVACVQGGLKETDKESIMDALKAEGFDEDFIVIEITPAIAKNVTETEFAPRGTVMNLTIEYNKLGLIDSLYKNLGSKDNIRNRESYYGMSEGHRK